MAIQLTAKLQGGIVVVTGDKTKVMLPHKAPAKKFAFKLTDETGKNVKFNSLAVQESESCPPWGTFATDQIVDINIHGDKAEFTDLNSGVARPIGYAWYFTCDDPNQTPDFDPSIINGGGNN